MSSYTYILNQTLVAVVLGKTDSVGHIHCVIILRKVILRRTNHVSYDLYHDVISMT